RGEGVEPRPGGRVRPDLPRVDRGGIFAVLVLIITNVADPENLREADRQIRRPGPVPERNEEPQPVTGGPVEQPGGVCRPSKEGAGGAEAVAIDIIGVVPPVDPEVRHPDASPTEQGSGQPAPVGLLAVLRAPLGAARGGWAVRRAPIDSRAMLAQSGQPVKKK